MKVGGQPQPKYDGVLAHLRAALGQAQSIVNTPIAEALAAALEVDRRISGDDSSVQTYLKLSDEEICELALDLDNCLGTPGLSFQLPLGSHVTSGTSSGTVQIDGERLTLDAGRAGLFPIETTSDGVHGPNLVLLRSEIERLTRRLACRRLGEPVPAQMLDGNLWHLVQFPPLAEAGGVSLQRSTSSVGANYFCAATPKQIKEFAREIVLDMRALWSKRKEIRVQAQELRKAAHLAITGLSPCFAVHAIGIEMKYQRTNTIFSFNLEYDFIDDAMRRGPYVQGLSYQESLEDGFNLPLAMLAQVESRNELNRLGADGWIDDLALGVLNATPEGSRAVLNRLATSYETVTTVPAGNRVLYATLYWKRGTIHVDLTVAGQLEWFGQELDLLGVCIPEMSLPGLTGEKLNSIVDLPFRCCCNILNATNLTSKSLVRVDLDLRYYLIDLETGRTWGDRYGAS